jgi:pimeloyl-ACP methyl ester carboxylesterase
VTIAALNVDLRTPQAEETDLAVSRVAVVLVHGAMDRHSSFDRVRRALPEFTTVAYDRRGYAGSLGRAFSGASPFDDHVNDLVELIDTVAELSGRPLLLAGHSYGTNVVIGAACLRAERVIGVVGYEPPMPWTDWWPGTAGGSTIEAGRIGGPAAAAESFMRRIVGDQIWERLPAHTKAARCAEGEALLADLGSLRGGPSPIDYRACVVPSEIGYGSLSLPHQQDAARETAKLLPDAELNELPDTGHGCLTGNPVGYASMVRRVIERT